MAIEIDLPVPEDPRAVRLAAQVAEVGNEPFLRAVVGEPVEFHHRSTAGQLGFPQDRRAGTAEPTSSLLLRAAHLCFTAHLPLSLSPDVLWYVLVHEVATHVRLDADRYAGVFGAEPGERRTIEVHDDEPSSDWERSIALVREPLREAVGERLADLFQPEFSTTTRADSAAVLVALMDVVSPYFAFRWVSSCAIPRIRLEGTEADWRLLASRARQLKPRFRGLRMWLLRLVPLLDRIADTAAGQPVDREFWSSFYKWESESGGDQVTGWVNAFFAHRYPAEGPCPKRDFGPGTTAEEEFPAHVSKVPVEWRYPGGTGRMVFLGGVLGIERDGAWVRPRLGQAVGELLTAAGPGDAAP
ncbi:DUF4419 domain-containing protein [Kitasatospora sp. NPDC051853]|uniref:DUF4419 domain-containing protein n=1 Tax=Kitasatospora sp. NPDC051853 TaxID=3364058 RepID=UPI00379A1AAF